MSEPQDQGLWAPVLEAERKDRSEFGRLPVGVRDQVIAGLDSGQLTLEEAAALLNRQGHQISRTALTMAYAKLRRLRRRGEKALALEGLVRQFQAQPSLDGFGALAKLLAAQAAEALLDDETGDPAVLKAVARALETMNGMARVELEREKLARAREQAGRGAVDQRAAKGGISRETIEKIEKEILGL
ncbi:MAG: DUF3486 family protein [Desulfarculus sp.]|nr:DUF3486 family protein [Desulfarculus sp.]